MILRKFLVFMLLFGSWATLVICGLTSDRRQVYSEKLMATEQSFDNGTGTIDLKSQVYSEESKTLLLNFETKNQSGAAIDPSNLSWVFYSKNPDVHATMEVIPIIDNKITVVVKNLPKNFDALAFQVTNSGVNADDISINIESSSSSNSDKISKKKSADDEGNEIQFVVTTKGDQLKYKKLDTLTRQELTSSEIQKEIKFQEGQKAKLKKAIKNIRKLIDEDNSRIRELQKEEIYLTTDQKEDNLSKIEQLNSEIESYKKNIEQAQKNIQKVEERIKMLEKKDTAIKSGKFKFSDPIQVKHNN
ncbi:hypothetical protein D3Z31_05715 [Lactobacillus murinus]|nr:hypothetical protein [Ligilactobacillus murinus]RII80099.1 hypothetical protein D1870_05715 [Ligilactobacillus murinus]